MVASAIAASSACCGRLSVPHAAVTVKTESKVMTWLRLRLIVCRSGRLTWSPALATASPVPLVRGSAIVCPSRIIDVPVDVHTDCLASAVLCVIVDNHRYCPAASPRAVLVVEVGVAGEGPIGIGHHELEGRPLKVD